MMDNNLLVRLIAAVQKKDYCYLKKILESADFEYYRDTLQEESLLHIGYSIGFDIFCFLLQYGINPNEQNEIGDTVLNYAAARNDINAIKMLLKNGAFIDFPNAHGEDAFSFACVWDSLEAAKLLFAAGSKMNWVKKYWTRKYLSDYNILLPSRRIRQFLLNSKIIS